MIVYQVKLLVSYYFQFTGEVISEEYVLEYGTDCLEMHVGAVQDGDRALVVDDLIATGGTLCAAIKLLGKSSGNLAFINWSRYSADVSVVLNCYGSYLIEPVEPTSVINMFSYHTEPYV